MLQAGLAVMRDLLLREGQVNGAEGEARASDGQAPEDASELTIGQEHFERALSKVSPSVSTQDRRMYEEMRSRLGGAR